MDALLAFLLVIALISIISARNLLPPFLVLIAGALTYGILTGSATDVPVLIAEGAGAVFALLGIPIYCGALIARIMRGCGFIERVTDDLLRLLHRPAWVAGVAGYLLSIPTMCCITTFIILTPVIEHLEDRCCGGGDLCYIAAYGSVLSFVLLFPLPVSYAVITTLAHPGFDAVQYLLVAVPLSVFLLALGLLLTRREDGRTGDAEEREPGPVRAGSLRAWAPVLVPLFVLIAGNLIPVTTMMGTVSIALLAGAAVALLLAEQSVRLQAFEKGTRNAGIIMFDLCGAGALGGVIAASPLAETIYAAVNGGFPALLVPFAIAALFQTAQGSRVVTAIATASLLSGSAILLQINTISLVLMIAAGTLVVSYVTDPYFWLVKRTSGDPLVTVAKKFTLPLALTGLALLAVSIALTAAA